MAVNQSQVDHIITAASEDDPEVKLQNLEREVDLIKTSIKRLLMDIRERMNELENPFTLAASGGTTAPAAAATIDTEVDVAKKSAMEAREAALDARESQLDATKAKFESEKRAETVAEKPQPARQAPEDRPHLMDDQVLALLRSQVALHEKNPVAAAVMPATPALPAAPVNEKLRLQKVYKLFKWTHQSVKKFGHDRLEIMLESYRAMGYITKESCDEIREISRLMPANLGEEPEVGPDEFVAELYALNRILVPSDTSLDRDMIEVMMEKRQLEPLSKEIGGGERPAFSRSILEKKVSAARKTDKDEEWMNLPDRI
ncbi:MAG: hypothetical protein EHM53_05495 [Methanoregulaceae archaeon]|nr:MAG: hypothetical protein EHM53_05495 [Methanoregulaceae archaeon]